MRVSLLASYYPHIMSGKRWLFVVRCRKKEFAFWSSTLLSSICFTKCFPKKWCKMYLFFVLISSGQQYFCVFSMRQKKRWAALRRNTFVCVKRDGSVWHCRINTCHQHLLAYHSVCWAASLYVLVYKHDIWMLTELAADFHNQTKFFSILLR